jgi:hypothetical protein
MSHYELHSRILGSNFMVSYLTVIAVIVTVTYRAYLQHRAGLSTMREGIQELRGSLHCNADRSRPSDPTVTSKGRYSSNLPRCLCNNYVHVVSLSKA